MNQIHTRRVNSLNRRYILDWTTKICLINQWIILLPPIINKYNTLHFTNEAFPQFPSLSKLHKGTDICLPQLLLEKENHSLLSPYFPLLYITHSPIPIVFSLFNVFLWKNWNCVDSSFKLLTMRLLFWISIRNIQAITISRARQLDDSHICDDTTRWWSLWHEYKNDNNNVAIYITRMLFGPKCKSDTWECILWTDSFHLTNISWYLHGSFTFDSRSDIILSKQYIALTYWNFFNFLRYF